MEYQAIGDFLLNVVKYGGAIMAIFGVIFGVYKWIQKQNDQNVEIAAVKGEIAEIKEELALTCYGLLAALKGLSEQGCDGPVTDGIQRIEKHLNKQAHK